MLYFCIFQYCVHRPFYDLCQWMMYNLFFFKFLLTFLWMHLAVGYLCHPLSVLSNLLVVGSSCQGCLFFLHFGVSTSHTLSSLVLVNLYCPCLFMLILYGLQFMPISLVACEKFLLPFCCPLISLFSCFSNLKLCRAFMESICGYILQ